MVKSKKTISTRAKKKSLAKSSSMDIINLILTDHKPLKQLIKILKREKSNYAQKLAAFNDFAPLLVAHAKPEEQTWYGDLRGGGKSGLEMRIMGIEGEIEHGLADQLCNELKKTSQQDTFLAKVKVLAELVEHHIEEEEEKNLPKFKRASSAQERDDLGRKYLERRSAFAIPEGYKTTDKIFERLLKNNSTRNKKDSIPASLLLQ